MAGVNETVGAAFIGVVAAAILYGITCIQAMYYFSQYPSDPWYYKFLVSTVVVADTCHQALISHFVYTYAITNFGVWPKLQKVVWSLDAETFFNAFTTFVVQCFLAMRVYRLSNKNWLATSIVMAFVIAEYVSTLVFTIKALPFDTYVEWATLNGLSMTVNVLAAAGDITISAFLCYLLQTSRTGFKKSDTLINKLMVLCINTGLLTSLCAFASLISINVWPHAWTYIGFYFCIGRLYCNSLLATLNARKHLTRRSHPDDDGLLSLHDGVEHPRSSHHMFGAPSKHVPKNISIKIDTSHEYMSDEQCSATGGVVKKLEVV